MHNSGPVGILSCEVICKVGGRGFWSYWVDCIGGLVGCVWLAPFIVKVIFPKIIDLGVNSHRKGGWGYWVLFIIDAVEVIKVDWFCAWWFHDCDQSVSWKRGLGPKSSGNTMVPTIVVNRFGKGSGVSGGGEEEDLVGQGVEGSCNQCPDPLLFGSKFPCREVWLHFSRFGVCWAPFSPV